MIQRAQASAPRAQKVNTNQEQVKMNASLVLRSAKTQQVSVMIGSLQLGSAKKANLAAMWANFVPSARSVGKVQAKTVTPAANVTGIKVRRVWVGQTVYQSGLSQQRQVHHTVPYSLPNDQKVL